MCGCAKLERRHGLFIQKPSQNRASSGSAIMKAPAAVVAAAVVESPLADTLVVPLFPPGALASPSDSGCCTGFASTLDESLLSFDCTSWLVCEYCSESRKLQLIEFWNSEKCESCCYERVHLWSFTETTHLVLGNLAVFVVRHLVLGKLGLARHNSCILRRAQQVNASGEFLQT